jgi:hypothetical protein
VAQLAEPVSLTVSFQLLADGTLGQIKIIPPGGPSQVLRMCVTAEMAKWKVNASASSIMLFRKINFGSRR